MGKKNSILGKLQILGKAIMLPIACMPVAGLLSRLGASDVFNLVWMAKAGGAIIDNLPLIFAIGIAIGIAKENNGTAGLAGAIGYLTITNVAGSFDKTINMGVLAGIIVGITAGYLYNKFKDIKLPQYLAFFGGKRFVPIVTSIVCLGFGFIAGYIWPSIQGGLDGFGNSIVSMGAIGGLIFGVLNRLLLPFGLHHVFNTIFWFEFGTFENAAGEIVRGDIPRFLNGDPTAGLFTTGFYFIMMFALPAACLAMTMAAKKEKRKAVAGMFFSIALTAFLTGITEPIEFAFMFLAPALYAFHALMTGIAIAVAQALELRMGFSFSAGLTDFILNFGISDGPIVIALVGMVFAVIYFIVFYFAIKKFNIKTPGREDDEDCEEVETEVKDNGDTSLKSKAKDILEALGGSLNIEEIDACITRIRLTIKNIDNVDEKRLKKIGASGIMKLDDKNIQVVVGTLADPIVSEIKKLM